MNLVLTRIEFRPDGIFSELKKENLDLVAHTVEHSYNNLPKIPDGVYTCIRGIHQLLHGGPFDTFMITNVPNHTNLLLHPGNWGQLDSDGCILLGLGIAQSSKGQMVTQSQAAFQEFMQLQTGIDSFRLTVQS